jgi:hypothetical protein
MHSQPEPVPGALQLRREMLVRAMTNHRRALLWRNALLILLQVLLLTKALLAWFSIAPRWMLAENGGVQLIAILMALFAIAECWCCRQRYCDAKAGLRAIRRIALTAGTAPRLSPGSV